MHFRPKICPGNPLEYNLVARLRPSTAEPKQPGSRVVIHRNVKVEGIWRRRFSELKPVFASASASYRIPCSCHRAWSWSSRTWPFRTPGRGARDPNPCNRWGDGKWKDWRQGDLGFSDRSGHWDSAANCFCSLGCLTDTSTSCFFPAHFFLAQCRTDRRWCG